MTQLRWGSATDIGKVREANQDSLLVADTLFAVADGMGGHQGGEVASAMALDVLGSSFADARSRSALLEAVRRANAKVWDKAQLDTQLHGMGTTITAMAWVTDDDKAVDDGAASTSPSTNGDHHGSHLAIVHVGDSRAYLMRDGDLRQITNDHSFVEEMVRAGEITADEALTHPKRNIVTRALGVEPTVDADLVEVTPQVGDRILLCSDGLTREVTDDQIGAVLRRLRNPDDAARELLERANANGGHDNITIVLVDVEDGDPEPQRAGLATSTGASPASGKKRRKGAKGSTNATSSSKAAPFTARTLLFSLAVLALIGIGVGSVVWYARASHFVRLEGEQVVIYRGRPEPVLWFEPTITARTNVSTAQVLPSRLAALRAGVTQESFEGANDYVRNLLDEAAAARAAGGTIAAPSPETPQPLPVDPSATTLPGIVPLPDERATATAGVPTP